MQHVSLAATNARYSPYPNPKHNSKIAIALTSTLREEHEEGNHEREEANRLRQGEAQDGVVEQSPHQVGLAGGGEQEAAEHVTDTDTDTGKRDRRQTCC